jgi:Homeodomain-like domain
MNITTPEAAGIRVAAREDRRALVAPLLAAGLSIRAISTETGIPVGAVHRIKRRIEKARAGPQPAAPLEPPPSYVVQHVINGRRQEVRRLTIEVYERAVNSAIGRGLMDHGDRDKPWIVNSAQYAELFSDRTLHWLYQHGYLAWGDHGKAEAVIAAVNALVERLPR